ncbi:MAG: thioredoxin family protein [Bacteroidales bacterium]|nr:thioredoxin family protein [Bacteroidales bacterium]
MKKLFLTLMLALAAIMPMTMQAQIVDPVKWAFSVQDVNETEFDVVATATVDPAYHIYSTKMPALGPLPTVFEFEPSNEFEVVGEARDVIEGEKFYDDIFEVEYVQFKGTAVYAQRLKKLSDNAFKVVGTVSGQACKDGICVQVSSDFDIVVPGANGETLAEVIASPAENNDVSAGADDQHAVLSASDDYDYFTSEGAESTDTSLWGMILSAILWGLAALLTPCVFPMVPMTVSFFMHGEGESKQEGRFKAFMYFLFIVLLYTLPIAILILVTYFIGGEGVTSGIFNWLATNWIPNLIFFLVFMIFAASFFGAFEITLGSNMLNKSDSKQSTKNLGGIFFMALTLVLVSFSCTGPIVGTVLIQSTQGAIWTPILCMLAFSIAFALPFAIFAMFPNLLQKLPKSGGWMNSVKVVLGFIEVALGFKFLMTADQAYGWGLLDREVYLGIWIVCFTLLGFYLLGKIRFKGEKEVKEIGVFRLVLIIIDFTFVIYMIPGMWGAPLKALSGYLPPQQTLDFNLDRTIKYVDSQLKPQICEEPKYGDVLELPHDLSGYFDYEQALSCARAQDKPVFVDFTGHGCNNCREMENSVWSDPEVLKMLREEYVVVALYVDDKTQMPEEDWSVSTKNGKVKKTIGSKNIDFQETRFGANAQPYYVLLDNDGDMLMIPRSYSKDKAAFLTFLKKGLDNYKNGRKYIPEKYK